MRKATVSSSSARKRLNAQNLMKTTPNQGENTLDVLDKELYRIIFQINTCFDFIYFSKLKLQNVEPVSKNKYYKIIIQHFIKLRDLLYNKEEIILGVLDQESFKNGINNLFNFWGTKVRENITKFFTYPSLLKTLDDIDKQVKKFESKKKIQKTFNTINSIKYSRRPTSAQKRKSDDESIMLNNYLAKNKYLNPINEKPKNKRSSVKMMKSKNENLEKKMDLSGKIITECNEEDEKNEEIEKEKKKILSMSVSSRVNNLESCLFHFQKDKIGKNILTIMRQKKTIIGYLDIDLFLQKIAIEQPIFENMQDNDRLLRGFCLQHPTFINSEVLVTKMISCFNYFYSRYLNINNENVNNKDYSVRESSSSGMSNLNNDLLFSQQNNNKRDKKESRIFSAEKKESKVFPLNLLKIPFAIVDLVLIFVEIHNKFSKNTLSSEIIKHIDKFYNTVTEIMDTDEIQKRFKNKLNESIQIIEKIKNGDNIIKSLSLFTREKKPLFENICLFDKNKDPKNNLFNILNYDSKAIAIELTRITYKILYSIDPKEFFKGVFTKKNKFITSPNISKSIDRFNKLSFWVIEEILSYDYANDRAKIIEKFIDIANELKNLNNFNDCMSMISGLGQMLITQLVKTWKSVSSSQNKVYLKIKKLLSFENNYKNLREQIDKCVKQKIPFIPFMGIYNKRICFLEEYGPYVKERSLVNVDKIVLVQQTLDQFYDFIKFKYKFIDEVNKNEIIMILQCLDPKGEAELEKIASFIEPNYMLSDKKTHVKRKTLTEINFKNNYEKLIDIL